MSSINRCRYVSPYLLSCTLHSTMSSINHFTLRNPTYLLHILHSTMSSINLNYNPILYFNTLLYIPLCHLLIEDDHCMDAIRYALHSTMSSINRLSSGTRIMMLLSLHSTMSSINLHYITHFAYLLNSFTFHYVIY